MKNDAVLSELLVYGAPNLRSLCRRDGEWTNDPPDVILLELEQAMRQSSSMICVSSMDAYNQIFDPLFDPQKKDT